MAFIVIYDACVLYPAQLRDLLMRTAMTGHVRARWTVEILDECFDNILENRPDLNAASLEQTRANMCGAVPDCLVTGYERLIAGITLPDPDDRHVVAAGIRAGAQAIVTTNLKDFPPEVLGEFGMEAKHPDEFIVEMIGISSGAMVQAVTAQANGLKNPPMSVAEVLDALARSDLGQSVALLRDLLGA